MERLSRPSMVREPPARGDSVGAAERARCERAGALRLLGDDSSAGVPLAMLLLLLLLLLQ